MYLVLMCENRQYGGHMKMCIVLVCLYVVLFSALITPPKSLLLLDRTFDLISG